VYKWLAVLRIGGGDIVDLASDAEAMAAARDGLERVCKFMSFTML
jgi:hypothetical protein